ncbi:MAG: hypothetical protein ACI94Y_000373 [Maribacter sp.]|jgi:hypothetical protein
MDVLKNISLLLLFIPILLNAQPSYERNILFIAKNEGNSTLDEQVIIPSTPKYSITLFDGAVVL